MDFSDEDQIVAINFKVNAYVALPNGGMSIYEAGNLKSGKLIAKGIINTNMPSDPRCPKGIRLNNISPFDNPIDNPSVSKGQRNARILNWIIDGI